MLTQVGRSYGRTSNAPTSHKQNGDPRRAEKQKPRREVRFAEQWPVALSLCLLAVIFAHTRRCHGAEVALEDRTADHLSHVPGFAGGWVLRGVSRQAIEVAGKEGGNAIFVAKEATERTSHVIALLARHVAFGTEAFLRGAEGPGHDRVARSLAERC